MIHLKRDKVLPIGLLWIRIDFWNWLKSLKKKELFEIFMCGYVHVSASACRSQKRAPDHLELELQAIVRGRETQTWVLGNTNILWKSRKLLKHWVISPAPKLRPPLETLWETHRLDSKTGIPQFKRENKARIKQYVLESGQMSATASAYFL